MAQANADPLVTVWDALERADCRPFGPHHQFRARCPGHDSSRPDSLAVGTGADGRALLWCHVGCDAHAIVRGVGLLWSDLFPEGHRHGRQKTARSRRRERPIDLALRALREFGIDYRISRTADMWVADRCPVCCESDRPWPLWITADERGRIGLSCFNGCDELAVLAALSDQQAALAA
jgi:hypothetical protein